MQQTHFKLVLVRYDKSGHYRDRCIKITYTFGEGEKILKHLTETSHRHHNLSLWFMSPQTDQIENVLMNWNF